MKLLAITLAAGLSAATPALAGGVADGAAGLSALNSGDNEGAIRLFTKALKDGDLSPSDQELAYVSRGKAYSRKSMFKLAATDFRKAVRLRPDDTEAQTGLQLALGGHAMVAVAAPPPPAPPPPDPMKAWGSMARLANQYWLVVGSSPEAYVYYQWTSPAKVLSFSELSRDGEKSTGQCSADGSGQISCTQTSRGGPVSGSVEVSGDAYRVTEQTNSVYTSRETYTLTSPTAFQLDLERYRDGTWTPARSVRFVSVSPDMVQALNWKEGSPSTVRGFFGALGNALLQSAVTGLQSGLQNGSSSAGQAPQ